MASKEVINDLDEGSFRLLAECMMWNSDCRGSREELEEKTIKAAGIGTTLQKFKGAGGEIK